MKRGAVILVNYGDYAEKHLAECYESLINQSYPKFYWSLFIVDNASTAATQKNIRALAPESQLIVNPANQGWGGGNNRGIETALKRGFDAVICLNMDTKVDIRWLEALMKDADRPDIHILQSKILIYGTDRINSLGNRIQFLGYGYCNGYKKRQAERRGYPMDFASGASMLIKREVFERIGFFREDYFMYGEDLEFCWRARLAGFRLGFCEESLCHHKYDHKKILRHADLVDCNRIKALCTLEKIGSLLLILPLLILWEIFVLAYFLVTGEGHKTFRLIRFFVCPGTWVEVKKIRQDIAGFRVCRDRELIRNFSAILVMEEGNPLIRFAARVLVNPILWIYWNTVRWMIVW